MFSDHIARAMALERQRDLVPDLREREARRSAYRNDDARVPEGLTERTSNGRTARRFSLRRLVQTR